MALPFVNGSAVCPLKYWQCQNAIRNAFCNWQMVQNGGRQTIRQRLSRHRQTTVDDCPIKFIFF